MRIGKGSKKGSEWVEWLSDNSPPAETEQQTLRVHAPASAKKIAPDSRERLRMAGNYQPPVQHAQTGHQHAPATPAVSIQINMPAFHLPKVKIPWKQVRYWAAFTVVVVGLSIGTRALIKLVPHHKTTGPQTAVKSASTKPAKPTFQPVAPQDKSDLANGKAGVTAYDASHNVYSYSDTYLGSTITVSEQPLPDNFKRDPGSLAQVAGSIGAKQTFQTAFGTAYVATSTNGTSQRVVFMRQNLLIFMESVKKYDNDSWKFYIESLR